MESPFNILSATALAESMKDYEGTWVLAKMKYSIFTWDFGKLKKYNSSLIIRDPSWI